MIDDGDSRPIIVLCRVVFFEFFLVFLRRCSLTERESDKDEEMMITSSTDDMPSYFIEIIIYQSCIDMIPK